MKLFKNLFKSNEFKNQISERRRVERYIPGKNFPLLVKPKNSQEMLKLFTISSLGLSISSEKNLHEVPLKIIEITLDQNTLELNVELKNSYQSDSGIIYGLEFNFKNYNEKLQFEHLILPVTIGSGLKEMSPQMVNQNEKEYFKRIFKGPYNTYLTLRYKKLIEKIMPINFEFEIENFSLKGESDNLQLEAFDFEKELKKDGRKSSILLVGKSNDAEKTDLKKLFFWVIENMRDNVEKDIISYLKAFK